MTVLLTVMTSIVSNAQLVITDDATNTAPVVKENISMMLSSVNKDKALIVPIIDNSTSITNMQDGMFAYKKR